MDVGVQEPPGPAPRRAPRVLGQDAGTVPEDFDGPLPDDVLDDFEGSTAG